MTTAHRPTWKAAVGQANEGGWSAGGAVTKQRSALDAPAHTTLKTRRDHQIVDHKRVLAESLLALEEAENAARSSVQLGPRPIDPVIEERGRLRLLKQTAEVDVERIRQQYDDADYVDNRGKDSDLEESDLDKNDDDEDDGDDDDDSDDDEDDEDALQAELAKIRAEREAARVKQEERAAAAERVAAAEAAIHGNPLLNPTGPAVHAPTTGGSGGGLLKRRWNDDVVFRNQAKGEPVPKKRFINDTVRNDFHKRFLSKFIR
jgi:protein CWC15